MSVEVVSVDMATVAADALLLAVDARLRVPGGAAWRAYPGSIDVEERKDVAAFVEADIRPLQLRDGDAIAIPAHGRYDTLVIAAALLHEVDGVAPTERRMLEVLQRAAQSACEAAAASNVRILAATLIGDRRAGLEHNHPMSSCAAITAMATAFARADSSVLVR